MKLHPTRTLGITPALFLAALLVSFLFLGACGGDERGVSSTNTARVANETDGRIGDGTAADAGAGDGEGAGDTGATDTGTADTATGDATASGDTIATDTTTGPKACTTNAQCAATEHCGLFYNGVQQFEGDDDGAGGKRLPGWANVCVQTDPALAKQGQSCDPFSGDDDHTLPACHNSSACQQGTCTSLCESDKDCVAGTICAVSEVPIPVKKGTAPATALLRAGVCVPMEGGGGDCAGDGDCPAGRVCRPYTKPSGMGTALGVYGRCVQAAAAEHTIGKPCGAESGGKGLAKLCDSALCQYTQGGKVAGICTAMCAAKKDCPETITYGPVAYKTACSAVFTATNDPQDPADDVFIPQCILIHEDSSAVPCTPAKGCTGSEACMAFAIARGPDVAASVEYLCVARATEQVPADKLLDTGAACDPNSLYPGCRGGYCLDDGAGKGFCSRTCAADAQCGGGTKCLERVLVPRADKAKAAITKLCQ